MALGSVSAKMVINRVRSVSNVLTPFPHRGSVHARIWAVRTPSGRRGRPGGRTDPPDGSPGPRTHKESGPQRTQSQPRSSSAVAARWRQPSGLQATGMPSRRTMAPLCRLRLPRWQQRPFTWSNTLRTCQRTAPKPSWLKRRLDLEGHEELAPADEGWTAGPESCARPCALHRNERRHDAHRDDGRGVTELDAR